MHSFATGWGDSLRNLARRLVPFLAHPSLHLVTGAAILLLDFWTGPLLMFPILFVVPVALSALFSSTVLAYVLAAALPLGRLAIALLVDLRDTPGVNVLNALIRLVVLVLLAFVLSRVVRQREELKTLRGRLPICM
jgi:hypothetical protein